MDILYKPFCVEILNLSDKDRYNTAAQQIFDRFHNTSDPLLQFNYYKYTTKKYVGYNKQGDTVANNLKWTLRVLTVPEYLEEVVKILKTHDKNYKIDNYTLI